MKKLSIIAILLVMFSFTLVAAQQEDIRFYHPNGENLTIYEKCRVDGGVCGAAFTCFLTVLDPDQNLIIDNVTMLDGGVYWNYTLNTTQTTPNGDYESTVDCSNITDSGSNTFFYGITPNGSAPIDEGQGLILVVSIILLVIISIFFAVLGFKSTNTTVQLSFIFFSILLIIFTLGLIVNIVELSFGTFSGILGNFSTIYVLFTVLVGVGVISLIVYLVYVALNYYWQLRGMKDTITITP